MADDLGALGDVPFDWAGADRLAAAFEAMAAELSNERGPRADAGQQALIDWQGTYSGQFRQRLATGDADAGELSAAMTDAAAKVRALKRAAQEEQKRREAARAYVNAKAQNDANESTLNKLSDWAFGEDFKMPPKPPPPTPEPLLTAPSGTAGGRG